MYMTFQALLLCIFLAQLANGQESFYATIGTQQDTQYKWLCLSGQHLIGGSYFNNPQLTTMCNRLLQIYVDANNFKHIKSSYRAPMSPAKKPNIMLTLF